MNLGPEFHDFLGLLNRHDVKYLVVGGYAVIHHGFPRTTGDLDVWFDATQENAARLHEALREFWSGAVPHLDRPSELLEGLGVQFGVEPNRIDLLNRIEGVEFSPAWDAREVRRLGGMEVPFVDATTLLRTKQAANRPKDQEDIEYLRRKLETSDPS